ncbi:MAG: peptidase [Frankiales bacterium]|nr:peptidase [Frankiales bacterium]
MDWTDLDAFQALPRLTGLALSPDGTRLVTCVATLDAKKQKWVAALWEIDPTGERSATRLTRSAKGEGGPVFTDGGDVLFVSGRPDPAVEEDEDAKAGLWLLPPQGEARQIGSRPGGVDGPRTSGGHVLLTSATLPGAVTTDDDARRRKDRKDRKISAILHSGYPIRYWDHDLGPDAPRLLLGRLGSEPVEWTDLTPEPGRSLDLASYDVTADGATVVTTWMVAEPHGSRRATLRALDVARGAWRVLGDGSEHEYGGVVLSPDGTRVAVLRWDRSTAEAPGNCYVVVIGLDGTEEQVVSGWDRWPTSLRWAPGGDALLVTADDHGAAPVFRMSLADGTVTRLSTDAGAYSDLQVSPDGGYVYALRSAVDSPPQPVRISAHVPGEPIILPSPADGLGLPGTLVEVTANADDGRQLRAWLAVPDSKGRHPLLLWVHGGPLASWNSWSWRWNPWLMVAQGYAVLLPDPALSTGYGLDHIRASWGDWGGATYTDVLRVTDAALTRADLDGDRTAMMGGSFGGYLANWIAVHTDRFKAIVTHASLWGLERFGGSTDAPWYWGREMTPEMIAKNDASQYAHRIVTPMLVVHGDKDYRVPVGEALTLWWDLCNQAADPAAMPHRFLYFPDENHWVLSPGHAVLWYQTVLSFLAWHVLDGDESVPEPLR